MRKLITDPAVYMPTAIVLLTMAVWVSFNGLGPAWERWQHERHLARVLVWTPEPWAITVDDFPAGSASELTPDEGWLVPWHDEHLDPVRIDALAYLLDGPSLPYASPRSYDSEAGAAGDALALNGVRVGATEVVSLALAFSDDPIPDGHAYTLFSHQGWLSSLEQSYAEDLEGVLAYEAVGDTLTEQEADELQNAGVRFRLGDRGYYGNRVVAVDQATGERKQIVGVATVAGDAFVAVGTVTPVGTEPDADAVELLERLAEKVRANPHRASAAVVHRADG